MNKALPRQSGFSLLEVLVAFSVLSICLGVLFRIFGTDGRLAGMAEEQSRAIVLAQSLLANAGVESPLQPGEFGGEADDRYAWVMKVSPFTPPEESAPQQQNFKPYWVELTVEWGEQGERRAFTLSTLRLVGNSQLNSIGIGGMMPR